MNSNSYATITTGDTLDFKIDDQAIVAVTSFTGSKDSKTVWNIDGRLAISSGTTYRWGKGKSDQPRVGHESGKGASYASIVGLSKGDSITITTGGKNITFMAANVTYDNGGTATAVAVNDTLASGTTYTLTADGHVDLKFTGWGNMSKLVVVRTVTADEVSLPTIAVTGTNGVSRTVTITPGTSTLGNAVTTYYTTDGNDPTTSSTQYTEPFTVSAKSTVKAISVAGAVLSNVASLDVDAGTEISVTAPVISISGMAANGSVYNPTLSAASDNASVLGAPTATLAATFTADGGTATTVELPYTATVDGTLTVTASAEGYASASSSLAVKGSYVQTKTAKFNDINSSNIATRLPGWTIATTETRWSMWSKTGGVDADGTANSGASYYTASGAAVLVDNVLNVPASANLLVGFGFGSNNSSTNYTIEGGAADGIVEAAIGLNTPANSYTVGSSFSVARSSAVQSVNYYQPVPTVTIDATSNLASYSNASAVTVPDGVSIYIATEQSATAVTLEKISGNVVPANTGVILYSADSGTKTLSYGGESTADVASNLLKATGNAEVAAPANAYALVAGSQTVAKVQEGLNIPANKAYLVASAGAKLNLVFDNTVTGVSTVKSEAGSVDAPAYNLAGQRVGKAYKGVVVKNGKKYILK